MGQANGPGHPEGAANGGANGSGVPPAADALPAAEVPTAADVPPAADKTVAAVIGEVVWLMSQSPEFKQYLIADLEWLVMPPVLLRQFRVFYHEGRPAGCVLWARVSAEVDARLEAGAPTLRPADWRSGERFRVVRTIAPFGGGEQFAAETEKAVLARPSP